MVLSRGKLAVVTILTPTVKELFAPHNSVVKRIVLGWKGMETVWKLAGSTILTPALEHCSFCLLF